MNAVVTLDPAFQAPVAAVFQGMDAADDLSGGITGGYGMLRIRGKVWAIHYRDQEMQLMREDGDGPKGSVELVILKANPNLSKTWYENGWDENSANPPDCSSANGITPDAGSPKKQSTVCATCPRNQWGTAANGGKGKACADHRRLAITPAADIPNEAFGGPMLLRCPAASLQDLAAFDTKYKQAGYPYFSMVVKIGFDAKESYPKLVFSAVRPLTEAEAQMVLAMRNSDAVARVIADQPAPAQALPAPAQAPAVFEQAAPNAPVAAAMQAQAPQQQAQQPAAPAPRPAPVQNTGFGAAAAPAVQPATQQVQSAAQPQPARQMTGFGTAGTPTGNPAPVNAAPAAQPQPVAQPVAQTAPQQPAAQTAPQPAPVAPAVATAFEASLDDKLAALLGQGQPA